MICNVQFTSNPVKQIKHAADMTSDAIESFKASRQLINSETLVNSLNEVSGQTDKSLNIVCESVPMTNSGPQGVHESMLERAASFAASLGNPVQNIEKSSLDYLI